MKKNKLIILAVLPLLLAGCVKSSSVPPRVTAGTTATTVTEQQTEPSTLHGEQSETETEPRTAATTARSETQSVTPAAALTTVPAAATKPAVRTTAATSGTTTAKPHTTERSTTATPTTATPVVHTAASTKPATTAAPVPQGTMTVTAYCDCKTAVSYGIRNQSGYSKLIPESGVLFNTSVTLTSGATAMDALRAAAAAQGVLFNEQHGYIKGVAGLTEKACGATSGWLYSVNGEFPQVSADKYVLKDNDTVRLLYSVKSGDTADLDWR